MRLDLQRPPKKLHARPNSRKEARGYEVIPHGVWGDSLTPFLSRSQAVPGTVYPAEPTITAEDAPNAAKLSGLGYIANPFSAWTTGQAITIGTFRFNWSGALWAAGPHA